jgi:hypothetical protein
MWCTQIGGKYHRDDTSIFRLKARLTALGISVSHPIADEIRATTSEYGLAFDSTRFSFSEVERDYYKSIRTSDFHTVCNQFGDKLGYTGQSASLEIAYAMCHNRPIVMLHRAQFRSTVDDHIRSLVLERLDSLATFDMLSASDQEIIDLLSVLTATTVDYDIYSKERHEVEASVASLLRGLDEEPIDASA